MVTACRAHDEVSDKIGSRDKAFGDSIESRALKQPHSSVNQDSTHFETVSQDPNLVGTLRRFFFANGGKCISIKKTPAMQMAWRTLSNP